MGRDFKNNHDSMVKDYGETFTVMRGDVSHQIRGMRDPRTGVISFPSDVDVQVGDQLTSVASHEQFAITTVKPHVISDVVTNIEARYETADQRERRLAAERAHSTTTLTIGTVNSSILNVSSQLQNVGLAISALPNTDETTKAAISSLLDQLYAVAREAPIEHVEDVETVTERAEALAKEARKKKPDQGFLTVSADGLKQAAANLAGVLPAIVPIATQLADQLLRAAHR